MIKENDACSNDEGQIVVLQMKDASDFGRQFTPNLLDMLDVRYA